jgi:hypothetical protein
VVPSAAVSLLAAVLCAASAAAGPFSPGAPRLDLRLQGIFGQPTTLLGPRGGVGVGIGYRIADQVTLVADAGQRAGPGGGIGSIAAGLQATLDATPISPYLEVAMSGLRHKTTLGYSLATRTGLGADYALSRSLAVGIVVWTYAALDPNGDNSTLAGLEGAVRLVFTPGAR